MWGCGVWGGGALQEYALQLLFIILYRFFLSLLDWICFNCLSPMKVKYFVNTWILVNTLLKTLQNCTKNSSAYSLILKDAFHSLRENSESTLAKKCRELDSWRHLEFLTNMYFTDFSNRYGLHRHGKHEWTDTVPIKRLYPKNLYEDSGYTVQTQWGAGLRAGSVIFLKANVESRFDWTPEIRGNFTKQKSEKEENRKQKRLTQIERYFWD